MRMDKDKLIKLSNIAGIVVLVVLFVWYALPREFDVVMPGLFDEPVTSCEAEYFSGGESEKRSFEPDSEDYSGLLGLLSGEKYRWQFGNIVDGSSEKGDAPVVTLERYARLVFRQGEKTFTFGLYGEDLTAGLEGKENDYTPTGGDEFQMSVVDYIAAHGTIVK